MNKLGIKLYGSNIYEVDGINYNVNSINHQMYNKGTKYKYRFINSEYFGIILLIVINKL